MSTVLCLSFPVTPDPSCKSLGLRTFCLLSLVVGNRSETSIAYRSVRVLLTELVVVVLIKHRQRAPCRLPASKASNHCLICFEAAQCSAAPAACRSYMYVCMHKIISDQTKPD